LVHNVSGLGGLPLPRPNTIVQKKKTKKSTPITSGGDHKLNRIKVQEIKRDNVLTTMKNKQLKLMWVWFRGWG
jgi:hypothetical protein